MVGQRKRSETDLAGKKWKESRGRKFGARIASMDNVL
jgi:hypothetical protein